VVEVEILRDVLSRALNDLHAVRENLTRTQERCSELLLENRRLRALREP
jgi:hypothetical protein